jgi:CRP-like cAMP-binding protein
MVLLDTNTASAIMQNSEAIDQNGDFRQLSNRLRNACLFRGLDDEHRDALLRSMICEEFAAEDVIIRQETITRNVWLLLDGQCDVIKQPPIGSCGEPVQLAQLHPFDVFGEMTLVTAEPHVASIEAKTSVRTLRLRGADFDKLTDNLPRLACRIACNLLHILSERLRSVDEKLTRSLDRHEELKIQQTWKELRGRLGQLYAGSPT